MLCLGILGGCAEEKSSAPEPSPTPLASLNTSAMQVPRIEFCQLVPASAVSDAVGGRPDDAATYGNGDVEPRSGISRDVLHEIGCVWSGEDGTTARAWVFARPVTPSFADEVVSASQQTRGCREVSGPAFGRPSYAQECTTSGAGLRVRRAGLFGQTWLSCELTRPRPATLPDLRIRTDAWCVEVANALDTAG